MNLVGQPGRVAPVLMLSGSGTAQAVPGATANADWSLIARVGASNTRVAEGHWGDVEGAGVTYTGDPLGQEIVGNGIALTFNESTPIRFNFNADARSQCFASCTGNRSASVDLSNTLNWMGLVVTDQNGQPVEFTISAESGVDYSQPVPEPGTGILMAVAVLGVVLRSKPS